MLIKFTEKTHINNPKNAVKIITEIIAQGDKLDKDREQFYVIGLNSKNRIKFIDLSTIGTLDQASPHPREIVRRALTEGTIGIIIAHNHPSGDPEPSEEDHTFTKRVKKCCALFDINLLDHIIVTESDSRFYSHSESGKL